MPNTKKFLDQTGTSHLWSKIKTELAEKAAQEELDALEAKVGTLPTGQTSFASWISAAETKINTLVGSDTGKSARTIANEELAAQLIPENAQEALDTLSEIAAWIQAHPEDASAMNGRITALEGIVEGIGGTDEPATVIAAINAAITALNIGDYAKAADLTAAVGRIAALEGLGITAAKVSAWDAAEANAKSYADTQAGAVYDAIIALTNAEIDTAIASANVED